MMKQNVLAVSILAAVGMVAQPAQALLKLTSSGGTNTAVWAKEVVTESSNTLTSATNDSTFKVMAPVGVGLTSDTQLWVSFTLDNGAKWGAAVDSAQGVAGYSAVASGSISTAVHLMTDISGAFKQGYSTFIGGSAQSDTVTYTFTLAESVSAGTEIGFAPIFSAAAATNAIKLAANSPDVNITFKLFNALSAAQTNTGAISSYTGKYIHFTAGYTFKVDTTGIATAAVADEFKKFALKTDLVTAYTATLGKFTLLPTTGRLLDNSQLGAATGTIISFLASTTKISVAGDFSFALATGGTALEANVYLSTAHCVSAIGAAAAVTGVIATGAQSVTFSGITTAATYNLCGVKSNQAGSINASAISLQLKPAAATGYKVADSSSLVLGEIKRDGAELQATFVTGETLPANRFIFVNKCASAASISGAKIYHNAGVTDAAGLTFPLAIPSTGRLAVQKTSITNWPTGANAIIFTVGATNACVEGTYQAASTITGVQTVVQMKKPDAN